MEQTMNLPKEYEPYEELEFLSNRAKNYRLLIKAGGFSPILIGKGVHPLVWIAQRDQKDPEKWVYVIYANKSFHPEINVKVKKKKVEIKLEQTIIVSLEELSSKKAKLLKLDLRPIGLNIYGDESKMMIGTNTLVGNVFENVSNIIAIN
jgi:hypothetical protein